MVYLWYQGFKTKESMMFLAFAFASGLQMMLGSNYSPYHEITQLVTWIVMTSAFKKNLQ